MTNLIKFTVETGFVTAICAIVEVILFGTHPDLGFHFMLYVHHISRIDLRRLNFF